MMLSVIQIFVTVVVWMLPVVTSNDPLYPITASWFRDRFSASEWDEALGQFTEVGGDTVWLRAPPLRIRTAADIMQDPAFSWCGSWKSPDGVGPTNCVNEAKEELVKAALDIRYWATYEYEENISDTIIRCPKFDKKINSSRIYYRLTLPLVSNITDYCSPPPGTPVMVLFTTFAGIDPHELLVQSAGKRNVSVYFGIPAAPRDADGATFLQDALPPYYEFVSRVLQEHSSRYKNQLIYIQCKAINAYDVIKGYYSTDEACIALMKASNVHLPIYMTLGTLVKKTGKKFVISPYIDLNRSQLNATLEDHVSGFEMLAHTGVIDVIAVQEGRGSGKGCYYWDNQLDVAVSKIDPTLVRIIQYLYPSVPHDVTYRQQFTASNNKLFMELGKSRDKLSSNGSPFELWLNVEAFEYLRDDPCLPVDTRGSGMAELLDRTSKWRLDWALAVASAHVQKVITFAWDSDYTCITRQYPRPLVADIKEDSTAGRPIIANCSWHSPYNMSIVILGYNLLGETQKFQVQYTDIYNKTHTDGVYGYYYETDYGEQNGRPLGLQYIMMFNVDTPFYELARHGNVTVSAEAAYHQCYFEYW